METLDKQMVLERVKINNKQNSNQFSKYYINCLLRTKKYLTSFAYKNKKGKLNYIKDQ